MAETTGTVYTFAVLDEPIMRTWVFCFCIAKNTHEMCRLSNLLKLIISLFGFPMDLAYLNFGNLNCFSIGYLCG